MKLQFLSINTDIDLYNQERKVWLDRRIFGVRADSMTKGIEKVMSNKFIL